MVVEMVHEAWGAYRQLGIAPKLSQTPGTIRSHAPELGEHTVEILTANGIDQATQQRLKAEGVI
jgi:crotonobetainyl-CoA:carnitine CoA-transferase CaiB-like acyl-CoA transferase